MNLSHKHQRGEGKVGCIVTLFIFLLMVAVGVKAIPAFWSGNELKDAAKDLASRASVMSPGAIEIQLRAKARELDLPEAAAAGAIKVKTSGDKMQGECTITLKYTRKIDFYGVTSYDYVTDTTVSAPYLNAN